MSPHLILMAPFSGGFSHWLLLPILLHPSFFEHLDLQTPLFQTLFTSHGFNTLNTLVTAKSVSSLDLFTESKNWASSQKYLCHLPLTVSEPTYLCTVVLCSPCPTTHSPLCPASGTSTRIYPISHKDRRLLS